MFDHVSEYPVFYHVSKELWSYPLVNKNLHELNPIDFGEQKCAPEYSYGPVIRQYLLIHYIVSGSGILNNGKESLPVKAGEAFIIKPGEPTLYQADRNTPWHYIWIGFTGEKSKDFCKLPTVIPADGTIFQEMKRAVACEGTAEEYLAGKLMELYAVLFSGKSSGDSYIRQIYNFVDIYYHGTCDVADIAKALNLERHYLARIFKQRTGKTLKAYITEKRIEEAKKLMLQGNTVSLSARMSGYKDPLVFSKVFRKQLGCTPTEWKKKAMAEKPPSDPVSNPVPKP